MGTDKIKERAEIQLEVKKNLEMDKSTEGEISNQQLQENICPAIKNMNSIIQENQKKMFESMQPIVQWQANLRSVFESFRNSILSQTQELESTLKQAFSVKYDFSELTESVRRMSGIISESIQKIRIPMISEERKQELIEAHKLWGSYGWTMNPCAKAKMLFGSMPTDKKTADAIALKQCSAQEMEEIFEFISKNKRVKKVDFKEAVFDYKHRQYKSCALILFSLVDAVLIRLQKKSDLNGKRRKVGLNAVSEARKRTETDVNIKLFFCAMFYTNLFACLEKVFEGGKDFKNQPDVINRNFLDHGMMTKKVRKKDCIQLFLLYYNMLELLDMIY